MKMTPKRMATIMRRYNQLIDLADSFARWQSPNGRHGPTRITDCGGVEEEVNTACHCHPEYEWVKRGTAEDFAKWLETNSY